MTHHARLPLLLIPFLIGLSALSSAQSLIICPDCSYEVAQGNFCQHCGAALKVQSPASTKSTIDKPTGPNNSLATREQAALPIQGDLQETESKPHAEQQVVQNVPGAPSAPVSVMGQVELQIQRDIEKTQHKPVSTQQTALFRFHLENAHALMLSFPDAPLVQLVRQDLIQRLDTCKNALAKTQIQCPFCKGSGEETLILQSASLGETKPIIRTQKRKCSFCLGNRTLPGFSSLRTLQSFHLEGRQAYIKNAQLEGLQSLGPLWLQPILLARLSRTEQARLLHARGKDCTTCWGLGRYGCSSCQGIGFIPCTRSNCQNTFRTPASASTVPFCTHCKDKHAIACASCDHIGAISCTKCKGSGERASCSKCQGKGLISCPTCKGTGKHRDKVPCTRCNQLGHIFCLTCGGDGYAKSL